MVVHVLQALAARQVGFLLIPEGQRDPGQVVVLVALVPIHRQPELVSEMLEPRQQRLLFLRFRVFHADAVQFTLWRTVLTDNFTRLRFHQLQIVHLELVRVRERFAITGFEYAAFLFRRLLHDGVLGVALVQVESLFGQHALVLFFRGFFGRFPVEPLLENDRVLI